MTPKQKLLVTYLIYVFTIFSLIILLVGYAFPHTVVFTPVAYASTEEVKTLDSEVDRLSIKYSIASSTIHSIIKCESAMYGTAVNHNRLKDGTIWSTDWGYLQINDYYHEATMKKLGLDIHNQWESLEYGFMLFKSQGSKPWSASRACWSKLI